MIQIAYFSSTPSLLSPDDIAGILLKSRANNLRRGISGMLSQILGEQGYDVTVAGDGKVASDLLATCATDLVLLDLNLPKKDGREALKEIKADPELRKIPVVVLTTSKADTDIGRIYELGANSFISKPVSFDSLVDVMKILGRYWFEIVELPVKKP